MVDLVGELVIVGEKLKAAMKRAIQDSAVETVREGIRGGAYIDVAKVRR